jgi:hypothetical protein
MDVKTRKDKKATKIENVQNDGGSTDLKVGLWQNGKRIT